MKKILFISLLFIIPFISAMEINTKSELSQGETFLAAISNSTDSILEESILFYRGHVRTSVDFSFAKINNKYYVHAQLIDKPPQNYSIVINDKAQNFSIKNTTADFAVNQGWIITKNNFVIEVENLNQEEIEITTKFNEEESSVILNSKETKNIPFELEDTTSNLQTVELKKGDLIYEIPVYVLGKIELPVEQTNDSVENQSNQTIEEKPIISTSQTCEELEGKVCSQEEKCDIDTIYAKDNVCCLGKCQEIEDDLGWKIILWFIIAMIIFIVWFLIKKYRGVT